MSGDRRGIGIRGTVSRINEIYQFGQIVLAIAFALAPLAAIMAFYLSGYVIVALASLLSGAAVLGILVGFRIWRRRQLARRTDWNPNIWMRRRISTALVKSPTRVEYLHKIEIEILRDDISRYNWRIGWTGVGDLEISLSNSEFTWTVSPAPADTAHILVIHFDRPRNKGDLIELEFGIVALGTERPQEPFYSATLFESRLPLAMTIRVEFADDLAVKLVQQEVYASDTAAWPLTPPTQLTLDRNRLIEWPILCVAGRRYGIRWELE